jgi:hypothetical protein
MTMTTNLSRFFQQRRLALGLRHGEAARRMGYKSLAGACNKLTYFEERGEILADLLVKLAAVLGVDHATIQRLMEQDRQEYLEAWNKWADEPIEPYLVIRAIPGFMISKDIPPHLKTQEEMEHFAAEIAERFTKKVWLILTRRTSVYFNESATKRSVQEARPGQCNGPWMRLGSSKKKFLLGDQFRVLSEPKLPH